MCAKWCSPQTGQRGSRPRTVFDIKATHRSQSVVVLAAVPRKNSRLEKSDAAICKACLHQPSLEVSDPRTSLERVFRAQPRTHQRSEAELCQLAATSLLGASDRLKGSHSTSSPVPQLTNVHQVQVGKPPGPPKSKEERQDDFYANLGDAIRTLREDVPICLKSEINYDIYRDDVSFRDPRNAFYGLDNYKLIFWSLRFHGNLFFKELYVEVKRIWQKDDDTICLRWTVHGFPRLPWDQEGTFDGVSTYKLDCHGKIYEHQVNNVIMSDPPLQRIPFFIRLSLDRVQQPLPSPVSTIPSQFDTHADAWFDSYSGGEEILLTGGVQSDEGHAGFTSRRITCRPALNCVC